jgi:hypothetical protein
VGSPKVKVLYVMGHGGSGSTILGNVLGELDGFFHVGELDTLWGQGMRGDQVCGCGRRFQECGVWSEALRRSLRNPGGEPIDPEVVNRWHREAVRIRHAARLLTLRPGGPRDWPALDRYIDVLSRLYPALAEATGSRVVVDSSKRSGDAAILRLIPGVDPYLVHLVRDPRAVAYSWKRREPHTAAVTTMRSWIGFNTVDELARLRYGRDRAALVRFEDFMSGPRATVESIAALVGERADGLAFVDDRTVRLGTNHTAAGHWSRFTTGDVRLEADGEWLSKQTREDRLLVTGLALPLIARYRYPVRVAKGRTASANPWPQGRSSA